MSNYPLYVAASLYNSSQELGVGKLFIFDAGNGGFGSIDIVDGVLVVKDSDDNNITPGGGGSGDMILASVQTVTGAKTFNDSTLFLRNVANTFSSKFTNTNTAARTYTLPDAAGTIALTSDLSSYATSTHVHGNITNAGAIGSTANLPVITTASGVLTVGTLTGTGTVLVAATSPTLITPALGVGTYTLLKQSGAEPSVTPTGTTATIDLNGGNMQTINLGSASGDVTLTLTVPSGTCSAVGSILANQGATARNITIVASDSSTIRYFDTKQDTSTDSASTTRGYHWRWNGSQLFIGQTAATTT